MHKAFTVHMLNEAGKAKAIAIAAAFDDLLTKLEPLCAPGRHAALVVTKLEEAAFFAKKAMASDPANGTEAPGTAQSVPTPVLTSDGAHMLVAPAAAAAGAPASEAPAPNVTQTEGDPFAVHR
jgi:hypothetical protein